MMMDSNSENPQPLNLNDLLVEQVKDYAIFMMDSDGRVVRWSVGAESILGYREAEIMGQSGGCIFTPEDIEHGASERELKTAEIEGRSEDERWHVHKDGTQFWSTDVVTALRDDPPPGAPANALGKLRGFVKVMRDYTERKQAEEEREWLLKREQAARSMAEEANRLKDEFLATVSHELRTPLNAMLGWAQLLRSRTLDEATKERALEIIERNARSQAQLIEDLLDISRIIRGQLRLNLRPIELVPLIMAAIDTVRPAAEAKAIQLNHQLDVSASLVLGNSDRLQQVVWNLLSNATKFTPAKGHIDVSLHQVDSQAQINVNDTGIGIALDFLPYVFDRFRQADSTSTRSHNGLGLGLAITRQLVELHGGTAHVVSQGQGQGARFTVKLPLVGIDNLERPLKMNVAV